jgi:hypothetical protein
MQYFTSSLLVSFLVTAVAAYSNTTTSVCDTLKTILPNATFYPETTTYNASITSYPFLQLQLHPTCIVRPNAPEHVATVVRLLRKNKNTKFAVKGGGHNANVGFNNVEDGVTIDMQSLSKVEHFGNVAQVGAGALWQNVYDVVEKRNHTVLGGRIGVVGVAGFLTGGESSTRTPSADCEILCLVYCGLTLRRRNLPLFPGARLGLRLRPQLSSRPRQLLYHQCKRHLQPLALRRSQRRAKQLWHRDTL